MPRSSNIFKPIASLILALLLTAGMLAILAPRPAPAAPGYPATDAVDLFEHLQAGRRLHQVVASPDYPAGTFVAPDGDWGGGAGWVVSGTYTATQAYALHRVGVALFRTSVQDDQGQDVAWENGYLEDVLQNTLDGSLQHRVLTETQIASGELADFGVLILPAFRSDYLTQVAEALGSDGLAALADFVQAGGTVYAQGMGAYLLEAAGVLSPGTVNTNDVLELPAAALDLGQLEIQMPEHPLAFNLTSDRLWVLSDPLLQVDDSLQVVASYSNTLSGPAPAIVYGQVGQGRVVLVAGHPVSALYPEQLPLFINGVLTGMAERGELYGRAIQTYDPKPGPTVIPAYEAGVPVSTTLCVAHLWPGAPLSGTQVVERVQDGFVVDPASVSPAPASLVVSATGTSTTTVITWDLGDLVASPAECLHYVAHTQRNALASGVRTFSQGALTYTDGPRSVTWAHPDYQLTALLGARLVGEHDKELDRFFYLPEEGLILDEFVFLENKEESYGYNLHAVRYIPLIVPVVELEDQRKPLHTNDGQTLWVRNEFFLFENGDYLWPEGFTSPTQTLNIDTWDGTTVITMTAPDGYHIDPPAARAAQVDGFFVTIPPTYTQAITVTSDHKLVLPAARVEWELGDFPGFWYEMPALRYGIHSQELFGRSVSFTGDPQVGSLVADATGGSVYTGLGADPLMYRDYLADVQIAPPQAPITGGLTYQDVWSRTYELPLRAGFYDLFNWAGCDCEPGEEHQRLNVTFGIKVDADGDGVREKRITDFDALTQAFDPKGIMPTRIQGDLDILIKTRNQAWYAIGQDENVIDGSVFRGLGFTITPRNGTWAQSYEADYSVLTDTYVTGGYEHLLFQQAIPVGGVDEITIHALLDATPRQLEGLLKLHDGVRFAYRQGYAGPAQYEVHDTHVQGVLGVRSDARIDSQANPSHLSTYSDTLFHNYELFDPYDYRAFAKDVFLQSWGFGDTAATTYVGGRDGRTLLSSLVNLGERTWLRLEVNNNSGADWTDVVLAPEPPPGIQVTRLYTDNVPPPMWPDLPFLNVSDIPDVGYGIYYFELTVDPAAVDLQGKLVQIPIRFQAQGAPADFGLAPAWLGVRAADGGAPRYASGTSHDLRLSDQLHSAFAPQQVRLLNQVQLDELWRRLEDDKTYVPRHTSALTYYQSLTRTIPFSFTGGAISLTLPVDSLPWMDAGRETPVYAVSLDTFTGTQATRYQVNAGGVLTATDDFGMRWGFQAEPDYIEANGAALDASYRVDCITHTLTGEPIDILPAYEESRVAVQFDLVNRGSDIAARTVVKVALAANVTLSGWPESVTPTDGGFEWTAGDLAPGVMRSIVVVFKVYVDPNVPSRSASPLSRLGAAVPIHGQVLILSRSDAQFINVYSGKTISARVGDALRLPYRFAAIHYLPAIGKYPFYFPMSIGSAYSLRSINEKGEVFYTHAVHMPADLPTSGRYYLSADRNQVTEIMVDDTLAVTLDGQDVFVYNFSTPIKRPVPAIVELPREQVLQWAGKTVNFEYRDVYGAVVEATPVWLIWVP